MKTQNRYNSEANFLPATVPTRERRQRGVVDVTAIVTTPATINPGLPLTTLEGAQETTSGTDRSMALVIRLVPFTVIWLILAVGVSWAASMGGWFTMLLFAGLTACTYAVMDKREYDYSRNGLERHKVDTIASLKRDEMAHAQELRKMALKAHLRMLGVGNEDYEN